MRKEGCCHRGKPLSGIPKSRISATLHFLYHSTYIQSPKNVVPAIPRQLVSPLYPCTAFRSSQLCCWPSIWTRRPPRPTRHACPFPLFLCLLLFLLALNVEPQRPALHTRIQRPDLVRPRAQRPNDRRRTLRRPSAYASKRRLMVARPQQPLVGPVPEQERNGGGDTGQSVLWPVDLDDQGSVGGDECVQAAGRPSGAVGVEGGCEAERVP